MSYAREDQEFVRRLVKRLTLRGQEVWVDWEDILPSAEWMREISEAIDANEVFVFVISPDSVASEVCRAELDLAVAGGKRIVPVLHRETPTDDVPRVVAGLNWLLPPPPDDFSELIDALVLAADLDLEWVRFHTRLLVRAREWRDHDGDPSYLMRGKDLEETQGVLTTAEGREPRLSPLQTAYVAESEAVALERQRGEGRGFAVTSLVFGVLQAAVIYVFAFDDISETGLIRLAPLWIFSIAFGGSGFVMARPTPVKMGSVGLAAVALAVFLYLTVWPAL